MNDPQPGQFWSTSKGRTVEIVAQGAIDVTDDYGYPMVDAVDVVAYKFLGGSHVHLRAVGSLTLWTKVEFE